MNIHKNARLTLLQRRELVELADQIGVVAAAADYKVSRQTCGKWRRRLRAQPGELLVDRSSRPHRDRRRLRDDQCSQLESLRCGRKTIRECAAEVGCSVSCASRFIASKGLGRLPPAEPKPPIMRYEHAAPGDLLHLDIKKLGRIERPGHRVTGDPRDHTTGAGYESIHIAIDDHSRVSFALSLPDESQESTVHFLREAITFYEKLGVRIARLLTDNGGAYRSKLFAAECKKLGIKHQFTRPYTPRTNGKAERFIQTALREWAYAHRYENSAQRNQELPHWLHRYNAHRPHSALGYRPPVSRLPVNNLSRINT